MGTSALFLLNFLLKIHKAHLVYRHDSLSLLHLTQIVDSLITFDPLPLGPYVECLHQAMAMLKIQFQLSLLLLTVSMDPFDQSDVKH